MARCNCRDRTCACVVIPGQNVDVQGNGSPAKPYVISASLDESPGSGWDPGDVKWSARATAPVGWLIADGSLVSRVTYGELFIAIGVAYGNGDGVTTFALPDLTGRFALGSDNTHPRGSIGGAAEVPVDAHLPAHTHAINHNHPTATSTTAGAHNHNISRSAAGGAGGLIARGTADSIIDNTNPITAAPGHSHNVDVPAFAGASGSAGTGVGPPPLPTMPPWTAMLPLIKT